MTELSYRPSPPPPQPAQLQLTERERELIIFLRRVDFFRASRERTATVHWSGTRLRVFDAVQIT